ncbi:MAG: efflux RND transporter periplasmic adaptor subunit [Planctomycetaceae bacterium]
MGQAAPPADVTIAVAESREIVDYREFTGRTAAVDSVEIRPRVSGYLLQTPRLRLDLGGEAEEELTQLPDGRPFHAVVAENPADMTSPAKDGSRDSFIVTAREGMLVKAGDPLFEIDPEPYRLAFQQATGQLKAVEAQLLQARRQLERLNRLQQENATSRSELDEAIANEAEAAGQFENLKATVERAFLDWQYTQVRSPITGLVGRSQITRGNLAIADTTVLTTVVTTDPIYVYFNVDENSSLDYNARVTQGEVPSARDSSIFVQMGLGNDSDFTHRGVVDFVDNTSNPDTGNKIVRARFENTAGLLSPGLFARVRAPFTAPYTAVLVPTIALGTDQQGRFVMVVDEQNQAHRQGVVTGAVQGEDTAIREGVRAGQQVIVAGLQRVRDGALVSIRGRRPPSTGDDSKVTDTAATQLSQASDESSDGREPAL